MMTVVQIGDLLRRVVNANLRRATVIFPAPVWDDSGTLMGAHIQMETMRGRQRCTAEASFSFVGTAPEQVIKAKVTTACDALKNEVSVVVRPVRTPKGQAA